jgi:hypothetical protein
MRTLRGGITPLASIMAKTGFRSVDEYLASKPADVRAVLDRVRNAIRKALPEAEETISYQIPVYKVNGVAALFSPAGKSTTRCTRPATRWSLLSTKSWRITN